MTDITVGALIYYIRRCLHDWNDERVIEILQNISCSMVAGKSRLLIAEMVLPDARVDVEGAWMDMTMLTFTGRERSRAQWAAVLDSAGLRMEKTHGIAGTHYGVVEAYLK